MKTVLMAIAVLFSFTAKVGFAQSSGFVVTKFTGEQFEILAPQSAFEVLVDIDVQRSNLVDSFVVRNLDYELSKMTGVIRAEDLLSKFARNWSNKLNDHFQNVPWNGVSPLVFGDIIEFNSPELGPMHAAVYIGHVDGSIIVFNKMGYSKYMPHAFMFLHEVLHISEAEWGQSDLVVYRAHSVPIDPATIGNPNGIVADFPGEE